MKEDAAAFKGAIKLQPQAAISWLYTAYSERMYRSACLQLNSRHDAEDICHEVFATAMENVHTYRGDASPYTWLYGILLNKTRKLFAARKTARKHMEPVARKLSETLVLSQTPEELAGKTETRDSVQQAINALPDDMQTLVRMRYFEEFTGEEMARVLGISHSRVRSRLSEARALLRNNLISKEAQL